MSALVADRMRTSTRRVRDEPSRSNSPAASTRSSFACCDGGTLAISSRNSVPPSASSNRPTRSARASVKAPRTWPNSSLSNTVSETPPALTVTIGRARARRQRVNRLRDEPFARAVLAGDQHVGVGRRRPLDELDDRLHRRRARNQRRRAVEAEARRALELPAAAQRPAQLDLRPDDGEQPRVVPRLLHEVARAAAHRLYRDIDAGPRGEHDDRKRRILGLQAREQIQPFLAGRRVAGVVEIDQRRIEVGFVDRREHGRGRRDGLHLKALALEEQLKRFEDVALVVGEKDAWGS